MMLMVFIAGDEHGHYTLYVALRVGDILLYLRERVIVTS